MAKDLKKKGGVVAFFCVRRDRYDSYKLMDTPLPRMKDDSR